MTIGAVMDFTVAGEIKWEHSKGKEAPPTTQTFLTIQRIRANHIFKDGKLTTTTHGSSQISFYPTPKDHSICEWDNGVTDAEWHTIDVDYGALRILTIEARKAFAYLDLSNRGMKNIMRTYNPNSATSFDGNITDRFYNHGYNLKQHNSPSEEKQESWLTRGLKYFNLG